MVCQRGTKIEGGGEVNVGVATASGRCAMAAAVAAIGLGVVCCGWREEGGDLNAGFNWKM